MAETENTVKLSFEWETAVLAAAYRYRTAHVAFTSACIIRDNNPNRTEDEHRERQRLVDSSYGLMRHARMLLDLTLESTDGKI